MSTVKENPKTDVEKLDVNWSVFSESECRILRKGIASGAYEHLAAMINSVTPEKAAEIARVQAQLRPRAFKFKSRVKQDFEKWLSKHGGEITPEIEAEWQEKIDAERAQALANVTGGAESEVINTDSGMVVKTSNELSSIKGLSQESIGQLNEAGVFSVDQLSKMEHESRAEILGAVTASVVKNFFDKQQQ